eukprot:COSAG01_NODE_432_length_17115_cov_126.732593_2_plen_51_part_00
MTDGQETHCLNSNVIQQLMQRLATSEHDSCGATVADLAFAPRAAAARRPA